MQPIDEQELQKRMYYSKPNEESTKHHQAVQEAAHKFARALIEHCPNPSRELSVAITKLEEAKMWANAAIAHNR